MHTERRRACAVKKKRVRSKPSVSTWKPNESNYRYGLSDEDRAIMEIALAAITRFKLAFDDWIEVGRAVAAVRQHADRIGGRKTFHIILEEQRIMPPLCKPTVSRLEKIMAHLDAVKAWRATLTESHSK
jgi:hypothetical protein